jgi:hypothetical protein
LVHLTYKYMTMTIYFTGLVPLTHKYMTVHFTGLVPLTHKYMTTLYWLGILNTQLHDYTLLAWYP